MLVDQDSLDHAGPSGSQEQSPPSDWPARDERQIQKLQKLLGQRTEEAKVVRSVNLATFRHLAWEAGIRCDWRKTQRKDLCGMLRPWVSTLTVFQGRTTHITCRSYL